MIIQGIFLDMALNENIAKSTSLKNVYNSLIGRRWQIAESSLLGNGGMCDDHEDIF